MNSAKIKQNKKNPKENNESKIWKKTTEYFNYEQNEESEEPSIFNSVPWDDEPYSNPLEIKQVKMSNNEFKEPSQTNEGESKHISKNKILKSDIEPKQKLNFSQFKKSNRFFN